MPLIDPRMIAERTILESLGLLGNDYPAAYEPGPYGRARGPAAGAPIYPGYPAGTPTLPWQPVISSPRVDIEGASWPIRGQGPTIPAEFDPERFPEMQSEDWSDPRFQLAPGVTPDEMPPEGLVGPEQQGMAPVVDRSFPAGAYSTGPGLTGGAGQKIGGLLGDYWPALLSAGLGILSQSGWQRMPVGLGQAIGVGGQQGLQTYLGLRQQYEQEAMRKQQAQQAEAQLARQQQQLGLNERQIALQERQDQANMQEKQRQVQLLQEYQAAVNVGDSKRARNLAIQLNPKEALHAEAGSAFSRETGLDENDPKNAQLYQAWLKKKTEFAPPVSLQVPVQMISEKAEAQKEGERRVKAFEAIDVAGSAANKRLQNIALLRGIKAPTGKLAPFQKEAGAWAQALGLPPGFFSDPSKLQAAETIAANVVLEKQSELKGQTSDRDMEAMRTTYYRLQNTPDANEFILDAAEAQSRRDRDMRRFYLDYFKKNKTYEGAEIAWEEAADKKSIFEYPSMKKWENSEPASKATHRYNPATGKIEPIK